MTKLPPQLMSGLKTTDIYFLEAGKSKIKMWAGLVSFEASLSGLQTAASPTDCLPSLLVDVLIFSYCVYAKLLSHVRLFGTLTLISTLLLTVRIIISLPPRTVQLPPLRA